MLNGFRVGDWVVHPLEGRLQTGDQPVHIRAKLMDLLVYFAQHPGKVVSKDELLTAVWRSEFVSESALTSAITELRQALRDDAERPRILETIPKRGYRLIAPVHAVLPLPREAGRRSLPRLGRLALALGVVIALTAFSRSVLRWYEPPMPNPATVRALIDLRPAQELASLTMMSNAPGGAPAWLVRSAFDLSRDGRMLVFAGTLSGSRQPRLFVRALADSEAKPLAGAEHPAENPVFSPDGRMVAYWTPLRGQLIGELGAGEIRRVPAAGGTSVFLARQPRPAGLAWSEDGWVYWGSVVGPIWRVPALSGGSPQQVTELLAEEGAHRLPHLTRSGQVLLFTTVPKGDATGGGALEHARIVAQDLQTATRRDLVGGTDGRYAAAGYLVFARLGKLLALRFDVDRLEVHGDAVSISDVMQAANSISDRSDSGAAQARVSHNGTLAFVPGGMVPDIESDAVWVDRSGREDRLPIPRRAYIAARLSPDVGTIALTIPSLNFRGGWFYNFQRETLTLATSEQVTFSVWSPDARRYVLSAGNGWLIGSVQGTDIAGVTGLPTEPPVPMPVSWVPGGSVILSVLRGDIVAVELDNAGAATISPVLTSPATELFPEISPDGRWLAHTTHASGRSEVVVRPYPALQPVWQISTDGGTAPSWRRDGRELFYITVPSSETPKTMFAVEVAWRNGELRMGRRRKLFDARSYESTTPSRSYDVSPDGHRFLMLKPVPWAPGKSPSQIHVVFNWFEELNAKVPATEP